MHLPFYHLAMLNNHAPLMTFGDGNCLYRAVSLAFTGTENSHIILKLFTALELILNKQYCNSGDFDQRIVCSSCDKLVHDAVKIKSFSEFGHFFALSTSFKQTITSYNITPL